MRVAECLTVLPFLFPETIWGLGLGCFLANLVGGLGFYDFFLGTIFTIVAGYLTSQVSYPFLAPSASRFDKWFWCIYLPFFVV